MVERADVCVVGGGVAGSAIAIALAHAGRSVVVCERAVRVTRKTGELLIPAARRLLPALGISAARMDLRHARCAGVLAQWEGTRVDQRDAVFDADGEGWHLDRVAFEEDLHAYARELGVTIWMGTRVEHLAPSALGWSLVLADSSTAPSGEAPGFSDVSSATSSPVSSTFSRTAWSAGPGAVSSAASSTVSRTAWSAGPGAVSSAASSTVSSPARSAGPGAASSSPVSSAASSTVSMLHVHLEARFLVDATGRRAAIARALGARRRREDDQVAACALLEGTGDAEARTIVERMHDGWWYAAPLPNGTISVAFHAPPRTARALRDSSALLAALRQTRHVRRIAAPRLLEAPHLEAAHGALTLPPAGPRWLAAGDAALSFDPLASRGLFAALYAGLTGADCIDRALDGDDGATARYGSELLHIARLYAADRAEYHRGRAPDPNQTSTAG